MVCQILSEMMLNFKHRLICNMQCSWLELMSATVLCIKQTVLPGRHACHNVRPCILNQVQHTRCSTCNDNHNNTTPSRPFKRLTPTEMSERRKRGLCHNCDEQYVRVHKCSRLFYLEISDYEEPELLLPETEQQQDEQTPLISLHAITRIHH
jgi:hypothetical protein